jgi:hypothetical protein
VGWVRSRQWSVTKRIGDDDRFGMRRLERSVPILDIPLVSQVLGRIGDCWWTVRSSIDRASAGSNGIICLIGHVGWKGFCRVNREESASLRPPLIPHQAVVLSSKKEGLTSEC